MRIDNGWCHTLWFRNAVCCDSAWEQCSADNQLLVPLQLADAVGGGTPLDSTFYVMIYILVQHFQLNSLHSMYVFKMLQPYTLVQKCCMLGVAEQCAQPRINCYFLSNFRLADAVGEGGGTPLYSTSFVVITSLCNILFKLLTIYVCLRMYELQAIRGVIRGTTDYRSWRQCLRSFCLRTL